MGDVWTATVKAIRDENLRRIKDAEKSLASLKNQTGWYAEDHRKVLELRREMANVIRRHIAAHQTILPAPRDTFVASD